MAFAFMSKNNQTQIFLFSVIYLFAANVYAKSASEVFSAASPSIVVIHTYDLQGTGRSLGSGVVVAKDVIATNCHVIDADMQIRVYYRANVYPAKLLHSDWDRDICTLTVKNINATPVTKSNTRRIKVGERVYAIGSPKGLELTMSDGIISSLRPVEGGQYLQITAPISQGSSGGGLFDEEGRLIGLPTFYIADGQQLNFAVPVEWINDLPKRHKRKPEAVQVSYANWFNKALALEKNEDWDELISHANLWILAQPENPKAWSTLSLACLNSKQNAKALEAVQQALRIDQNDAVAWYIKGNYYSISGEHAKSIEAYQQAVRIHPSYGEAWYNMGLAYDEIGQYTKAIEIYQQAVRINPVYVKAWYNLGFDYDYTGEYAKAIEAYRQVVRLNPDHAEAWNMLGLKYNSLGRHDEAIAASQQAVRISPEDAKFWTNLGSGYNMAGNNSKAIQAYQQALNINPELAGAWFNLGKVYSSLGQNKHVINAHKQLQKLDPELAKRFHEAFILPQQ